MEQQAWIFKKCDFYVLSKIIRDNEFCGCKNDEN